MKATTNSTSKPKVSTLKFIQLTSLKPPGMSKRFQNHFEEVRDIAYLLQCAVMVLVKNALSPLDYSNMAKDVICKLLLEGDVKSLAAVRHLCVYFKHYFSEADWAKVVARLFKNQKEFLAVTASTQKTVDHLHNMLHCGKRHPKELMNIATIFKDANGKKHRFTFKDVDPCYTIEETTELLSILTTLTIFEKDGVRRFTELVRYTYQATVPVYDAEALEETTEEQIKEKVEEKLEKTAPAVDHPLQPLLDQALKALALVTANNEPDAGSLMESPNYLKNNVYAGKTSKEIAAYLFDGFTFSPTDDSEAIQERILSALISGTKLKDAPNLFDLSDNKTAETSKEPEDVPKNTQSEKPKNKKGKSLLNKLNYNRKTYFTKDRIEEQWADEKEAKKIKKALDKKKPGKKKPGKKKRR